jgi:hypothetical protein
MKRLLQLFIAMAALHAASASATGINLAWDECGGPDVKTFACNTNSGTNTLTASVILPIAQPQWVGMEVYIDLMASTPALPLWWQMKNSGSCRLTALSGNASGFGGTCIDPYQGAGAGGIAGYLTNYGGQANRARIIAAFAVPVDFDLGVEPDIEYGACNVTINNTKSTGLGQCDGCGTCVFLVLSQVISRQEVGAPGGDIPVTYGEHQWVYWQGICPPPDPAQRATWGAVKALYR